MDAKKHEIESLENMIFDFFSDIIREYEFLTNEDIKKALKKGYDNFVDTKKYNNDI